MALYLRVIDFTLAGLRRIDEAGGLRCAKCEAKSLVFASRVAELGFERRARKYERQAVSVLSARSLPLSIRSLQAEVAWYVNHAAARANQ